MLPLLPIRVYAHKCKQKYTCNRVYCHQCGYNSYSIYSINNSNTKTEMRKHAHISYII